MFVPIILSFISLWIQLWAWETIKSIFFVDSFHFLLPLSSQLYLFCIVVWHIKELCLGGLRILWYLVILGALRILHLGLPHILGLGWKFLLCICLSIFVRLLRLLLIFTIPVFFHILADRAIWSHLHCSGFGVVALGFCWSSSWVQSLLAVWDLWWSQCCWQGEWVSSSSVQKDCQTFPCSRPRCTSMNRSLF